MFFRYEVFQNAPKATKKSMLVGLLTSWMVLALVVVLAGGIIGAITESWFSAEDANYILGFGLGIVLAVLIKLWGKKRMTAIRKMAEEEAKRYSKMSEAELRKEEEAEEKKVQKGNKMVLAIFFFAIAAFFLFLSLMIFKPGYINISEISGGEVACEEIYFVEDLRVEKAYYSISYPYKTRHFAASFIDKYGKKYVVDFEPDYVMENEIAKSLDENEEFLTEEVTFSGYFKSEEIQMEAQDNFSEVSVDNTEKVNTSFSLICGAEDNFFMTVNKASLVLFGVVAVFALLGVFYVVKMKKQK